MKAALNRIFKKNLLLLLALIAAMVGMKYSTLHKSVMEYQRPVYYEQFIREMEGMSLEEQEDYVDDLFKRMEDRDFAQVASDDVQEVSSGNHRKKEIQMLVSFAQKLEGPLPVDSVPTNYLELLEFYAKMGDPGYVHSDVLDKYFMLQGYSAVPVIVLFLSAVIWGVHYESEIYRYTGTTRYGRRYSWTTRITLLVLAVGVLTANELYDLWYSGLLGCPSIFAALPIAYSRFYNNQLDMNIGQMFIQVFVSKMLGTLILCHIAELVAQWKKNLKDTIIYTVMVLVVLVLLGRIVKGSEWMPLLQVGMVDWRRVLSSTQIILSLGITAFPIGLGLNVLLEGAMVVLMLYTNRRK